MLTMGSLFDGIGGFPLAAVYAGISPVWASEIEALPIEGQSCRRWTSSAAAHPARISAWLERGPDFPVPAPAFLWSRSV